MKVTQVTLMSQNDFMRPFTSKNMISNIEYALLKLSNFAVESLNNKPNYSSIWTQELNVHAFHTIYIRKYLTK